jgi:hypothetical protein
LVTITWDADVDAVFAGDLTTAIGYRTPAGGVVVQAVAPIGLRDRDTGELTFTTSLGFSKKLERIERDPRIALAYHARDHGLAGQPIYVLAQGDARVSADPPQERRDHLEAQAERHLGALKHGRFWDYWLREYYEVRVPVDVALDRIVTWPDLRCSGEPSVSGEPLPAAAAEPQAPPKNGTGPRIDSARAGKRLRATSHTLLGFAGADGRPVILPVEVGANGPDGLELRCAAPLPPGGRRAGLTGHSYRPQLIGLETRQHTGWLSVDDDGRATYAPHTEVGYKAPPNKTLLLLVNGGLAKRGVRAAAKAAH